MESERFNMSLRKFLKHVGVTSQQEIEAGRARAAGGRKLMKIESRRGLDTMQAAGWAKQVIDQEKPARMFIDIGGVGVGVYDRLVEMGYEATVRAVNFGSAPMEPPPLDPHGKPSGGPVNRRAEMWMKSKEWLEDVAGVQIPDSDSLQADACGPSYKYDSHTRLQLESKDQMRVRGVPSPDEWDAVALTFAEPVRERSRFDCMRMEDIMREANPNYWKGYY